MVFHSMRCFYSRAITGRAFFVESADCYFAPLIFLSKLFLQSKYPCPYFVGVNVLMCAMLKREGGRGEWEEEQERAQCRNPDSPYFLPFHSRFSSPSLSLSLPPLFGRAFLRVRVGACACVFEECACACMSVCVACACMSVCVACAILCILLPKRKYSSVRSCFCIGLFLFFAPPDANQSLVVPGRGQAEARIGGHRIVLVIVIVIVSSPRNWILVLHKSQQSKKNFLDRNLLKRSRKEQMQQFFFFFLERKLQLCHEVVL